MSAELTCRYFLSQVVLDELPGTSPYETHRSLWRGFLHLDLPAGAPQPFRYRRERVGQESDVLMVQSEFEPHWPSVAKTSHVKEVNLSLAAANSLGFKLQACVEAKKPGTYRVKTGIYTREGAERWLHKKAAWHGFEVLNVAFSTPSSNRFKMGDTFISLSSVVFEGTLGILDATAVAAAVHTGVGPRGFAGYGMLSLFKP